MFQTLFKIVFYSTVLAVVLTEEAVENEIKIANRIVGGYDISIISAPYQAFLVYPKTATTFGLCGAVIISEKWLLTAAHCAKCVIDIKTIHIYFGETNLGITSKNFRKPDQFIRHEDYISGGFLWDIALIQVSPDLPFSSLSVMPIPLATRDPPVSEPVFVTGWGSERIGGPMLNILHRVTVMVISRQDCQKSFPGVNDQHICAGVQGGGKGPCNGDSGGPMVMKSDRTLVGITSQGDSINCSNTPVPNVFASIPYFRGWIRRVSGV